MAGGRRGGGAIAPSSNFWMLENCQKIFLVRKFSSINAKFVAENPSFGGIWGKN